MLGRFRYQILSKTVDLCGRHTPTNGKLHLYNEYTRVPNKIYYFLVAKLWRYIIIGMSVISEARVKY